MTTLAEIEAQRAARKAVIKEARDAQRAIDLIAVDALEREHGDARVKVYSVPFNAGLPTLAAVRCPSEVEILRYQAIIRPQGSTPGDPIFGAEQLAEACLIYPDAAAYAKLKVAVPGLHLQLGVGAADLASASAEAAGKN